MLECGAAITGPFDVTINSTAFSGVANGGTITLEENTHFDGSTASITLNSITSSQGCTVTAGSSITGPTVNPGVDFVISTLPTQTICNPSSTAGLGGQVVLTDATSGTGKWSGGAGTFSSTTNLDATYTPDVSEIGTTVTLTLTADDPDAAGPCTGGQTTTVDITVNDNVASVSAGTNQTVCYTATEPVVNLTGVFTMGSGATTGTGMWTGGAGTFGTPTMNNTTHTPLESEIGTTVTLTFYQANAVPMVQDLVVVVRPVQ